MSESTLKINSLRLRFERGSPEPTDHEVFNFMKVKMGLKSDNLLSMYKDKPELSIIIKFKTEEDFKSALLRLPGTMEFAHNKYQCSTVQLSAASTVTRYVRLFNLPPEVEDREIWAVLSKFGRIQRMVREKYGAETGFPIWSSVRGIYMELKEGEEIPATVNIRNLRARVYYEGLVNKCFQCGGTDHLKADCPKRKTVNDRLDPDHTPTYSGALTGEGNWSKPKPKNPLASSRTEEKMTNLNKLFPKTPSEKRIQNEVEQTKKAEILLPRECNLESVPVVETNTTTTPDKTDKPVLQTSTDTAKEDQPNGVKTATPKAKEDQPNGAKAAAPKRGRTRSRKERNGSEGSNESCEMNRDFKTDRATSEGEMANGKVETRSRSKQLKLSRTSDCGKTTSDETTLQMVISTSGGEGGRLMSGDEHEEI